MTGSTQKTPIHPLARAWRKLTLARRPAHDLLLVSSMSGFNFHRKRGRRLAKRGSFTL